MSLTPVDLSWARVTVPSPKGRSRLSSMALEIIKIALFVFSVLWLVALTQKDRLPGKMEILAPVLQEPFQTATKKEPFSVTVRGETYDLKPVFDYELNGLIVSNHRSDSWIDISHERWNDYLNVEDICVVYNENISSEIYKRMKFHSRDWSCHPEGTGSCEERAKQFKIFKGDDLSNNHILANDPVLKKRILGTQPGDQIRFKGYLVNYNNQSSRGYGGRDSSLVRDDFGCEIIYVTDFQILKKANVLWRFLYPFSGWMILILSMIFLVVWYYEAFRRLCDPPPAQQSARGRSIGKPL